MPLTIDDSSLFRDFTSDVCWRCRHLRESGVVRTCDAFPNGIPDQIWNGWNKHTSPYPGDHGIQFEPVEEAK